MTDVMWTEQAPGVWSLRIGEADPVTPLALLSVAPRREALESLGAAALPPSVATPVVETVTGNTVVRLPLTATERLFGLGLQFFKVDQRGRTRFLRANSDPRQDTGETHAPVPFLVSSRGYGVLVNTARIVTFYCGSCQRRESRDASGLRDRSRDPQWQATPVSTSLEIVVPGDRVELFAFAGQNLLEVVRRYNLFCGGGALPPRWGLGFWHRVHYQHSDTQTLEEAREFRSRDFPCDVIGLEPGWQSKSYPCSYEWDQERFPDPAGFLAQMRAEGFEVNLWEHGYVSPAARIYPALEPLSGSHTVWGGLVPDLTLPVARGILQQQHETDHVAPGVSGYKLDECDGSELTGSSWMFPAHATFPSGCDGERMRQVYGLLLQKLTLEIFRKRDRRTYGLVRASTAGASSLPYVLYSDLYNHREFVRALCNSGFSGLLWTPEVRAASTPEEWVRRMQVVCFSPLAMLNAWSDATKPWSFPEVEPIIRHYLQLRMRLLPYFYAAFARYYFDGTPPFRALALELDGSDGDVDSELAREGALDDQYMAGDSLLVAPLFAGETTRKVYLPHGVWYDFDSGQRFEGGRTLQVTLPVESGGLGKLPVFVREGGIVPLMPPLAHAPRAGEMVPLEVRHYGTRPGRFALFDDDGETFAYERGDYAWRVLEVDVSTDGTREGRLSAPPDGRTSSYGEITWSFLG
jgi:alpha-D-xyloside xylohydrolase